MPMTTVQHEGRVVRVITRLNLGGPAQHAILLTARSRLMPTTLVTGLTEPYEADMMDLARAFSVSPVVVASLRNGGGLLSDLRAFIRLYRIFRQERPKIAHLHLFKARALGMLAARLARVPIVVETFHGTVLSGYFRPAVTSVLVSIERLVARMADAIIAISDQVARELTELRIGEGRKIRVIPLGLDLEGFLNSASLRGRFRSELNLDEATPLVGTIGRLVPVKSVDSFLRAASIVADTLPQAQFVVIGDGPERPALEDLAARLGVKTTVRFLGWRRDTAAIYADLDLVVLSSVHEGTPVTLIEAMASSKPVVATRVGGVPDVVKDGVTGILVGPRNPDALAAAIVRILTDSTLRERFSAASRAAVYPRYAFDRLLTDIEGLYMALLDKPK